MVYSTTNHKIKAFPQPKQIILFNASFSQIDRNRRPRAISENGFSILIHG